MICNVWLPFGPGLQSTLLEDLLHLLRNSRSLACFCSRMFTWVYPIYSASPLQSPKWLMSSSFLSEASSLKQILILRLLSKIQCCLLVGMMQSGFSGLCCISLMVSIPASPIPRGYDSRHDNLNQRSGLKTWLCALPGNGPIPFH